MKKDNKILNDEEFFDNEISNDEFEQDDKGILKHIGKYFKLGVIAFLSTLTISIGGTAIYGNIALADYSNNAQINSIAQALDCDLGYITQVDEKYVRMQHNGDEPIYVCFDSKLTEVEKACAVKSLDYLFGIVGKIDSHYTYKIVDENEYKKQSGETRIYYDVVDRLEGQDKTAGFIDSNINRVSNFTSKRVANNFNICHNRSYDFTDLATLEYSYCHELLHSFGIDDVYVKAGKKFQGNTFIKQPLGENIKILSPNDMKCLISLYAPKMDVEENVELINNYKKLINDYEKYYYQVVCDEVCKDLNITENIDETTFYWQGFARFNKVNNEGVTFRYNIKIDGDKYTFKISDFNNKVLDTCEGEVVSNNGIIILKDMQLIEGFAPGFGNCNGYIQDNILIKNKGVIKLVDLLSYKIEIYGFASNTEINQEKY